VAVSVKGVRAGMLKFGPASTVGALLPVGVWTAQALALPVM
jgi:hypothetical protein